MSPGEIGEKSKRWQRERTVARIFSGSVVAKKNFTCAGGFFQGLQQAVECLAGEHVHFVDDEDAITAVGRRVPHMLNQLADVIDPPVGRAIHLDHVDVLTPKDPLTNPALVARLSIFGVGALQGARENPRHRRLSHAARAAK